MSKYYNRRNARNFGKNPAATLCFTFSIIALVAGIFGAFALFGGASCLAFTIVSLIAAVLLFIAGKKLFKRKK